MMRRIYILILLACSLQAAAIKPVQVKNIMARTVTQSAYQYWFTMTCPPDPYPQYPWYKMGGICSSAIGNNDYYAVFNIADSVLYHFSGGTIIVNTPGCPPLPNPWYPYDSLCNSTIGNYDIYAIWYVLHLIDSIQSIHPPINFKIAPTYMTYAFSTSQIDTMTYLWDKHNGTIDIPPLNGFKALGKNTGMIIYDANDSGKVEVDTTGVLLSNLILPSSITRGRALIWGRNGTKLAAYPQTGIDTVQEWQFQTYLGNFIFRNGLNGWHVLLASRSKKDTVITTANIATYAGNITGTLANTHIPMATGTHTIADTNIYDYNGLFGINAATPVYNFEMLVNPASAAPANIFAVLNSVGGYGFYINSADDNNYVYHFANYGGVDLVNMNSQTMITSVTGTTNFYPEAYVNIGTSTSVTGDVLTVASPSNEYASQPMPTVPGTSAFIAKTEAMMWYNTSLHYPYFYNGSDTNAFVGASPQTTGIATLSGGTKIVSSSAVKAASIILVSYNTPSGTSGILSSPSASIISGTSFVINSSAGALDNSTVNWLIINK